MQDDGLDFFQIIEDLFNNKYLIIFFTIIFTAFGYFYNYDKTKKLEIKLPISEISKSQQSRLSSINLLDLDNVASVNYELGVLEKPLYFGKDNKPYLTSTKLIEEFYNEFYNFNILRASIKKNNISISEQDIISKINKYKLIREISGERKFYYFTVHTNEQQYISDKNFLINLIKNLNTQVKLNIIDEINNLKNSISFSESIRKNLLSLEINENIENYKINIKSRLQEFVYLVYLRNNLNIDVNNELTAILKDKNLSLFINYLNEIYLNKDNILNIDINKIYNDNIIEDVLIQTTELINLRSELNHLSNYNFVKIVDKSIENSGLSDDNFNTIQYDLSLIETIVFKSILENYYVFTLFGFCISSVTVLILSGYRRNRESLLKNK